MSLHTAGLIMPRSNKWKKKEGEKPFKSNPQPNSSLGQTNNWEPNHMLPSITPSPFIQLSFLAVQRTRISKVHQVCPQREPWVQLLRSHYFFSLGEGMTICLNSITLLPWKNILWPFCLIDFFRLALRGVSKSSKCFTTACWQGVIASCLGFPHYLLAKPSGQKVFFPPKDCLDAKWTHFSFLWSVSSNAKQQMYFWCLEFHSTGFGLMNFNSNVSENCRTGKLSIHMCTCVIVSARFPSSMFLRRWLFVPFCLYATFPMALGQVVWWVQP